MSDKDDWVLRVLGLQVGSSSNPDQGKEDGMTREALVASLRERVKEMVAEAKLLGDRQVMATVAGLGKDVLTAIEKGDLVAAELAVDSLESTVAQAKSAARRNEASKTIRGTISYRKAQIEWRQARNAAFAGIRTLTNKLLADSRVLDSPDSDGLVGVIQGFPDLLPEFDEDLEELLDAIDATSDPERRKPLIAEARATLKDYRALLSDQALNELQALSDDEFGGIDVMRSLDGILQKIEGSLSA